MKTKFYSLKNSIIAASLMLGSASFAQDARVQIIHNSADAATATVDIYAGSALLFDDVDFRTATPFFDVAPGTVNIGIAPGTSTGPGDILATFPLNLMAGETYVAIANGILVPAGYNPAPGVTVDVYAMGREESANPGETDVLVFHGSTDAPTVDVVAKGAGTVVDDAAYGDFAGYLELANDDYTLNVTDATGATVVKSYQAPLQTLGLADSALVVVASGFLDPSMNNNGEEFGLWVALPSGGALIELPESEGTLQVIHNSADAAAAAVDIYFNGDMLIDDFAFRTASAYIDVPAEVGNEIAVAPSTSTSVTDALVTIPITFEANETYVAIANGIISPSGYSPATAFSLDVYDMGQETSNQAGNTDVLVFHGSTDAPTVDVSAVGAGTIVDDAAYGDFAGYLELGTADYILEVQDMGGTNVLFSYSAPLSTLMLDDLAIVVVASGFVDPSMNSNGAGFGLWVALPSGGAMVELPAAFSSIEETELDFNLFPNPATDMVQFTGLNSSANVIITNMAGQQLFNDNLNNSSSIDVSTLPSGIYMITVKDEGMTGTQKFTIK